MSDLVFSKAYFDCLMTPGGSSALTTSSKKDLLTNLSSVKDDKLTINRNTITSPEEMYRAFVEWFRRWQWKMPEKLEWKWTPEEYVLDKFPDLKENAAQLVEFVAYAGAFPPPVTDAEFYMNAVVFDGLLGRGGPQTAIRILKKLGIKDRYVLFNLQSSFHHKSHLFIDDLRDKCIEHFGAEELKRIMSSYKSTNSIPVRDEEMTKIIAYCTQSWFSVWEGEEKTVHFMSPSTFFYEVPKHTSIEDVLRGGIKYLGAYKKELKFFLEACGIPFEKFFALPLEEIAHMCSIVRKLENAYYTSRGPHEFIMHIRNAEFTSVVLEHIFSPAAVIKYKKPYKDNDQSLVSCEAGLSDLKLLWGWMTKYSTLPVVLSSSSQRLLNEGVSQQDYVSYKKLSFIRHLERLPKTLVEPGYLSEEKLMKLDEPALEIINEMCYELSLYDPKAPENMLSPKNTTLYLWRVLTSLSTAKPYKRILQAYDALEWVYPSATTPWKSKKEYAQFVKKTHTQKMKVLLAEEKLKLSPQRNQNLMIPIISNLSDEIAANFLLPHKGGKSTHLEKGVNLEKMYTHATNKRAQSSKGLYSIGAKIHFPTSIPEKHVQKFIKDYNLPSTAFKLIHANSSVIIPPSQFWQEPTMLIAAMSESHLFDKDPQLQVAIPGRMCNASGGLLATALMLSSQQYVEYNEKSFSTTHNSATGRRMVTYDAGVYDPSFPWNTPGIKGRTDVVLLKDINLLPKAQMIGSLFSQVEHDGMFAELGYELIRDYCELLSRYNMESIISAPWIFDPSAAHDAHNLQEHLAAVKKVTEKQKWDHVIHSYSQQRQWLLVFELEELLTTYEKKIQSVQQRYSHAKNFFHILGHPTE